MNYTNIFHPQSSTNSRTMNIVLVITASWMIALSAQISFQLPFSPVPVTGQTLIVLLCGMILGKNLAAAAVGAYLIQGAAGLPVFAGGKSGLATLLGPTGGYLIGFLAAAYLVGSLSELQHRRSPLQAAATLLLGNVLIYLFGLAILARFVGETQALQLGLYPFLIGDVLKLVIATLLVSGGGWLTDHLNERQKPS
jgi:biotin transport system substrate-specific component